MQDCYCGEMDPLAGLRNKLRFIERHYAAASARFRETKRKIDGGEESFEPPPFDAETATNFRPPFLEQWQEADESLNIEGQVALQLVQGALRDYLSSLFNLYGNPLMASGTNWLRQYRRHFLETHGIDWEEGPVPIDELEEFNLARSDVRYGEQPSDMPQRPTKDHEFRFFASRFVDEIEGQVLQATGQLWPGRTGVTEAVLKEAIRRVEILCDFLRFETAQKPLTVV
jgi:hypothetical protein